MEEMERIFVLPHQALPVLQDAEANIADHAEVRISSI
jgi:hypothetical protein